MQGESEVALSVQSAGIAEQAKLGLQPLVMMLKFWGPTMYQTHTPPDCSGCKVRRLLHIATTHRLN